MSLCKPRNHYFVSGNTDSGVGGGDRDRTFFKHVSNRDPCLTSDTPQEQTKEAGGAYNTHRKEVLVYLGLLFDMI